MLILKPIIICLITLFISLIIKNTTPEFLPAVMLCAGITIMLYLIPFIKNIIDMLYSFSNIDKDVGNVLKMTVKIIVISIVCEFSSQLCHDSGESYLAAKIIFSGKIVILAIILPFLITFMKNIINSVNEI